MLFMGCSTKDVAETYVLLGIDSVPKGTKLSIDEIFESRNMTDGSLKPFCKLTAESMVHQGFTYQEANGTTYVFSRDTEGKYFWKELPKPGLWERIKSYICH